MAASAWGESELATIATLDRRTVSAGEIERGERYVGLENMTSDGRFEGVGGVEPGELKSNKFRFGPEHVLYGKLRPYLSKIARPNFTGICSTDILPIRPGPELDGTYLMHFLRTPAMVRHATTRATGINLPRLSPKELQRFVIPLPPIEEQRRIATVLDAADSLRAKRRQALAKLDDLTQATFIDMFGDPLTTTGPRRVVADVAEVVTGNTPPRSDETNYGPGIEWIKSDNIEESGVVSSAAENLSAKGEAKGRVAPASAPLVVCIAGSPASIGRVGLLDRPVAFNQQINAILPGPVLFPTGYPTDDAQREIDRTLLECAGSADDIAKAVAFLLENDYLTGVALPVDGGRLLT